MSGTPRTGRYVTCTGDWACSVHTDGRHCTCVQDSPTDDPAPCCQCAPRCVRCGKVLDPATDPGVTTLGARCSRCW